VAEAADRVCHVRGRYETHHRVLIPEDVVRATLPVIDRCVRDRALPDKALDVLDRAAAVASLGRSSSPGEESEMPELTRDDVLAVLSEMTRIPVARLHEEARRRHARMEEILSSRVVGQEAAVRRVSRVLRAARTNLVLDQRRPKGIFLFVGPTGVGKTELARAMAELLFGTDERLVRIDMSEYMERINQSRLIGTAPGYVGYNDQNQLTDEVRKQPHSLVLLDEIEKADNSMLNLFLQVFDAGRLTDGKGRTVHFDSTTICMTSNVGTHLFSRAALGFEEGKGQRPTVSDSELLREVKRAFTPEFLNRIDEIICFKPLADEHVLEITRHVLARFETDLGVEGKRLVVSDAAARILAAEGHSPEQGARNLERTIRRLLLEPLAQRAVEDDWEDARVVRVGAESGHLTFELDPEDRRGDAVSEPAAADMPLEDEGARPPS
jgi:ATP-dependent Clp protease ATP-binding subunit ClpC